MIRNCNSLFCYKTIQPLSHYFTPFSQFHIPNVRHGNAITLHFRLQHGYWGVRHRKHRIHKFSGKLEAGYGYGNTDLALKIIRN